MKKNGFTFIEMLGVITVLVLISIIVLVVVDKSLKDSKKTLYNAQLGNIRSSARMWMADNIELIPDEGYYTVTLEFLQDNGYIGNEIRSLIDDSVYDKNMVIQIGMNDILLGDETGFESIEDYMFSNANKQIEIIKNQNLIGTYQINSGGQLSNGLNSYKVNFVDTKPSGGFLTYNDSGLDRGCIAFDKYKATIEDGELRSIEQGLCDNLKCIRANKLHIEKCDKNDSVYYCSGAGYTLSGSKMTDIVTYGNKEEYIKEGTLQSGDAFDCDVNGDGIYDFETERFYYVSDLYDAKLSKFDSNYAVLIYYSNTINGSPNNTSTVSYDSLYGIGVNENWHGPESIINDLPTIEQWNNIDLANNVRIILNEKGTGTTFNGLNILPNESNPFIYTRNNIDLAARLLTVRELESGCGITIGSYVTGELDKCNYLLENTKYTNSSLTYVYLMKIIDVMKINPIIV